MNLSFESEQQQQQGCLQTTPKIFRFSKDRKRNQPHPQRLPLAAIKPRRAASNENKLETETKHNKEGENGLEVSGSSSGTGTGGWRNIEIKRIEVGAIIFTFCIVVHMGYNSHSLPCLKINFSEGPSSGNI